MTSRECFRLPQHQALINRMGFNNKGVDHLVTQVQHRKYSGVLGINIGKNASTALDDADQDYLYCLERVYPHADYITVNISSPNTSGLRDLQHGARLRTLLDVLKNAQSRLATQHGQYKPIAVKIAPDMSADEITAFCDSAIELEIDAIIAGNTTQSRTAVANHLYARETGGLSGAPLKSLANEALAAITTQITAHAAGTIPVIGVGGINCGADAAEKISTGAELIQLYSGLIYHGPALVRDCIKATQ